MTDNQVVTWSFALQETLERVVGAEFPEELHRWPLLRGFYAQGYVWKGEYIALVLRDRLTGLPSIDDPESIDAAAPDEPPDERNLPQWHAFIQEKYEVGPRDMVMMVPTIGGGQSAADDWKRWTPEQQSLWQLQMRWAVERHLSYLRELDARKGGRIGAAPPEISESLARFRKDYPAAERVGFLMMRLADGPAHGTIASVIRAAGRDCGLVILRADDKEYHSDLYFNVLTYLHGSGFGVALFERIEQDDFNPNVSLEVGYMLALGKPVCLLKDQTLRHLHTDLLGKMYREFDTRDPEGTLPRPFLDWLSDKEIAKATLPPKITR